MNKILLKGICESCGMKDIQVTTYRDDNGNSKQLCNQCRPADGAYAY